MRVIAREMTKADLQPGDVYSDTLGPAYWAGTGFDQETAASIAVNLKLPADFSTGQGDTVYRLDLRPAETFQLADDQIGKVYFFSDTKTIVTLDGNDNVVRDYTGQATDVLAQSIVDRAPGAAVFKSGDTTTGASTVNSTTWKSDVDTAIAVGQA